MSTALGIVASLYAWGDHVTFAIDSVSGNDAAPAAVVEVPETDNPLPSVYVLLLDELSLSLVNAYASFTELPNIGRLVEQGTYLPRAYSTTDLTMTSVPSALTGLLPSRERFARGNSGYETDWLRDANNLISDLERLGYRVTITPDIFGACAVVACSRLEAADLLEPTLNERDLFQFAVDHFVHQVSFGQQPAPDVGELFRGQAFAYLGGEQVDLGHDTDQPQFVFLHFMQTHYPYTHARDGTLHGREPVSFDHATDDNAATIAANAFESVLWADLVLGPIVDALLALPAEERIVLLMSDHGVELARRSILPPQGHHAHTPAACPCRASGAGDRAWRGPAAVPADRHVPDARRPHQRSGRRDGAHRAAGDRRPQPLGQHDGAP